MTVVDDDLNTVIFSLVFIGIVDVLAGDVPHDDRMLKDPLQIRHILSSSLCLMDSLSLLLYFPALRGD